MRPLTSKARPDHKARQVNRGRLGLRASAVKWDRMESQESAVQSGRKVTLGLRVLLGLRVSAVKWGRMESQESAVQSGRKVTLGLRVLLGLRVSAVKRGRLVCKGWSANVAHRGHTGSPAHRD